MKVKNNSLEQKVFEKLIDEDLDLKSFCALCDIRILDFFKVLDGKYIPNLECALLMSKQLDCTVNDLFRLECE